MLSFSEFLRTRIVFHLIIKHKCFIFPNFHELRMSWICETSSDFFFEFNQSFHSELIRFFLIFSEFSFAHLFLKFRDLLGFDGQFCLCISVEKKSILHLGSYSGEVIVIRTSQRLDIIVYYLIVNSRHLKLSRKVFE